MEHTATTTIGTRGPLLAGVPSAVTEAARQVRLAGGLTPRVAVLIALMGIAFALMYLDVVRAALDGSRTAIMVTVPVLAALIASGYHTAPRGVTDDESNWILAIIAGLVCFGGIELLCDRIPTLTGLWQLRLLGAPIWLACLMTVLVGVRHVVQMWPLWVFSLVCGTPLPFLLATAALGGSDTAATAVAATVGAVAVYLATPSLPRLHRGSGAAACLALAAGFVMLFGAPSLFVAIVVVSGVFPVLIVVLMRHAHGPVPTALRAPADSMPNVSATALAALLVVAAALPLVYRPAAHPPEPAPAPTDWARAAVLSAPRSYPFITRYLGPGATLQRYAVSPAAGMPAAAVDVITTDNPAALDDFRDAVWYPSPDPVSFHPADPALGAPPGARIAHTNADATTEHTGQDWYAVTWDWRLPSGMQRVTVIVSQSIDGQQTPPAPRPFTVHDVSLRPTLWVARQQPDETGRVDETVLQRAAEVVRAVSGE